MNILVATGLTLAQVSALSLKEAEEFLKNPVVIAQAQTTMDSLVGEVPDIRRFLVAYLIVSKQSAMFSNLRGLRESRLYEAASSMLQTLETLLSNETRHEEENVKHFKEQLDVYFQNFEAWRRVDVMVLGWKMQKTLLALLDNLQSSPNCEETKLQIRDLSEKIIKTCGVECFSKFMETVRG